MCLPSPIISIHTPVRGGSLDALPAGPDVAVSRHAGAIPLCDGLAQWGNDSCATVMQRGVCVTTARWGRKLGWAVGSLPECRPGTPSARLPVGERWPGTTRAAGGRGSPARPTLPEGCRAGGTRRPSATNRPPGRSRSDGTSVPAQPAVPVHGVADLRRLPPDRLSRRAAGVVGKEPRPRTHDLGRRLPGFYGGWFG